MLLIIRGWILQRDVGSYKTSLWYLHGHLIILMIPPLFLLCEIRKLL